MIVMDDIKKKFQADLKITTSIKDNPKKVYQVIVDCDANDGDTMDKTFQIKKKDFESDYRYQFVLAFVSKNEGKFCKWREGSFYGNHITDSEIEGLEDYCIEEGILIFCGAMDQHCHSVEGVEVTYFDEKGEEFEVELPNVDDYFDTKEELVEYLENLLAM